MLCLIKPSPLLFLLSTQRGLRFHWPSSPSRSASLTHKLGNTEHRCRELSGQVPGQTCPTATREGPVKAMAGPVPASGMDAVPLDGWGWSSGHVWRGERPHRASIRLFNTAVWTHCPCSPIAPASFQFFSFFCVSICGSRSRNCPQYPQELPMVVQEHFTIGNHFCFSQFKV